MGRASSASCNRALVTSPVREKGPVQAGTSSRRGAIIKDRLSDDMLSSFTQRVKAKKRAMRSFRWVLGAVARDWDHRVVRGIPHQKASRCEQSR